MKNQIEEQQKRILELKKAKSIILNNWDILLTKKADRNFEKTIGGLNDIINLEIKALEQLEEKAKEKEYTFYFQYTEGGTKQIVETRNCKVPGRTKTYKTLEDNFNDGFIHSFGYERTN